MQNPRQSSGLSVSNISHAYGRTRVIDDVSFDVGSGEILCMLGPSGCGKSTTLRLIAGLEKLQQGIIRIGDVVMAEPKRSVPPEKRSVGLLFQDFALFPHLTVYENVTFGLSGWNAVDRKTRADEVLDQVGMLNYSGRYPHELSGGEQQRIALARARAPQPNVMLLDEPFSNLDSRLRYQLRDLVLHVLKKSRAATVIVTHDPEEAMFLADKIAVMNEGRIVQIGTPEDLYFSPSDAYVAGLFSELNKVRGFIEDGHVRTAVGRICAPEIAEGTAVEVFIRPEAVRIGDKSGSTATARVQAARMLGRSSMIHLSVAGGTDEQCHLHARIPGHVKPSENEMVGITLDQDQIFVFPDRSLE